MTKPRKFKNIRVRHPDTGEWFDSKGELGRWHELQLLERAGKIRNLQRQNSYPLHGVDGVTTACHIQPDYDYEELQGDDWVQVTEDFKSAATMTAVWKLKSKLFAAEYQRPIRISGYTKGKRK